MLNQVQLIGHLGQDPIIRHTQNNTAVANFSVATSKSYKDKNGNKQEETQWHNITAWGKLAEICGQYLTKGSRVYIQGELKYSQYEKEGVKVNKTEINASEMKMLDSRSENKPAQNQPSQPEFSQDIDSDGLPF